LEITRLSPRFTLLLLIVGAIWALLGLLYFAEGVYANVTNGKASPSGLLYIVQGVVGAGLAWGGFCLIRANHSPSDAAAHNDEDGY
jgi:uncharacterized membrane protein YuzA (DUF378 family)